MQKEVQILSPRPKNLHQSAAYPRHGSCRPFRCIRGSSEFGILNSHMMAFGLYLYRKSDKAFNLRVSSIASDNRLQVYLRLRKQARPQFAVGGESKPVAFPAEMAAEGMNSMNLT